VSNLLEKKRSGTRKEEKVGTPMITRSDLTNNLNIYRSFRYAERRRAEKDKSVRRRPFVKIQTRYVLGNREENYILYSGNEADCQGEGFNFF